MNSAQNKKNRKIGIVVVVQKSHFMFHVYIWFSLVCGLHCIQTANFLRISFDIHIFFRSFE